jgi:hypothetical protein
MPPTNRKQVGATTVRERILDNGPLRLTKIAALVDPPKQSKKLFDPQQEKGGRIWKRYFQSPVDKAACLVGTDFQFDQRGALLNWRVPREFLLKWLRGDGKRIDGYVKELERWLEHGDVLPEPVIEIITRKLKDETLEDHDLYNQPVCRLVRSEQLRYDPDYQALYQLTPAQSRLINPSRKGESETFEQVNRNRRIYWGISPIFQSLVAMFDSELGGLWDNGPGGKPAAVRRTKRGAETKEFIRIEFKDASRPRRGAGAVAPPAKLHTLTPSELNEYSPLRFWAPPPVFARFVFHMIFWRSVITNRDLYGRVVIRDEDAAADTWARIGKRVDFYYVIINWFNAATYTIAGYAKLFEALMALARSLSDLPRDKALKDCADVSLDHDDDKIKELFLPYDFQRTSAPRSLDNHPRPRFRMPFRTIRAELWELAQRYQTNEDGETRVSDVLKFIRDRALELILWSKYQMEIRSVGTIPVQHLYRIEIDEAYRGRLCDLVERYERARRLRGGAKAREYDLINEAVREAIRSDEIDSWVRLWKVYGGVHREIVDRERLRPGGNINWLLKPSDAAAGDGDGKGARP